MSTALEPASDSLSATALDRRFRRPLLSFFFRRTHDWTDAEDLTQQTFLRLHQIGEKVSSERPQAFVFSVASFLLKEHWTRQRAEGATRSGRAENIQAAAARELTDDHSPERLLLERDELIRALRLLEELGPRTKAIYVMFRVERKKHSEIADMYGISVSAVKKHIMKAAGHLARQFGRP